MNLRELQQQKRPVVVDKISKESRPPVGCVSPSWLACYPTFQDALQSGETNFRALPHCAKLSALKRIATSAEAQAFVTPVTLNEVRAAYIELSATCVVEAVESYLAVGTHSENLQDLQSTILDTVAAHFRETSVPLIARQPCLLSPGKAIFLDGWTRFFAYWARCDRTIPLLAVDWPVLYDRLAIAYPGNVKPSEIIKHQQ